MPKTSEKQTAEHYHRLGNFVDAKTHYELHLKQHPDDDDTLHALGVLLAQSKQYPEALDYIQRAISKKGAQATYYNSLGNVFRQLNDPDSAIQSYKKAIKINPQYSVAYNNLGNVFFQQAKKTAARQSYEKAISLKADYADAHCNLGILLVELEDDDAALPHLKKALELNPRLFAATSQLGDWYLRHEQYAQARELFLQCIEKSPENAEFHHRLGICYFKLGDFEQAKNTFEKVLMLDYKHPEANQYLANTLLEFSEHEKAMHYYCRQLEKNPLFETYYNLGVLYMMKDKHRDALLYFDQALLLQPDDIATTLNRGNIFLKRSELGNALMCYEKANTLKPNDPEITHILSALKQDNISSKAPDEFISNLFDQYAPYYDQHLTERLSYDVPKKMLDTIQLENPYFLDKKIKIVDLGCGTGLCGALFKPFASSLIGIDLSEQMLSVAREKVNYDELIQTDIVPALTQFSDVDLILSGDVFAYLGNLELTFKNAANALSENGLFIFTVEKTLQEPFVLQPSIRYAHSKTYLESLIAANGFELLRLDNIQLRKQKNEWIEGYLVLVKR